MSLKLTGKQEFQKRVAAICNSPYEEDTAKALGAAAQAVARVARSLAPVRTGRLRKAITGRQWRQSADARRRYGPGAFAQTTLRRQYLKSAPYGHIVEDKRHYWQSAEQQAAPVALEKAADAIRRIQQDILDGK